MKFFKICKPVIIGIVVSGQGIPIITSRMSLIPNRIKAFIIDFKGIGQAIRVCVFIGRKSKMI